MHLKLTPREIISCGLRYMSLFRSSFFLHNWVYSAWWQFSGTYILGTYQWDFTGSTKRYGTNFVTTAHLDLCRINQAHQRKISHVEFCLSRPLSSHFELVYSITSQERIKFFFANDQMRSLDHLLRRSFTDESTRNAYRWLFSRAQYLQKHSPSKSLFGIFRSLIEQYHRDVPIEYLCGSAMFSNRLFIVNRHALIPRRDSEALIDHVEELYQEKTTSKWK